MREFIVNALLQRPETAAAAYPSSLCTMDAGTMGQVAHLSAQIEHEIRKWLGLISKTIQFALNFS